MLVTKILALALATVVAAESAEVQHEARDDFAATLYRERGFRGASQRVVNGRCTNVRRPVRNHVKSILVSPRSDCYAYFQDGCRGAPTRQERSKKDIRYRAIRSVRCVRDRR